MKYYSNLIEDLLRAGLLATGETLQAARKFELQAEVLADGKLLLNAWPRPLGIRAVTNKAHEIEEWGVRSIYSKASTAKSAYILEIF